MKKKLLFISWTLGLGHITRDLAIAKELRSLNSEIELSWLACPPALEVLTNAGEFVLPESSKLTNETALIEQVAKQAHRVNLLKYCIRWANGQGANLGVFNEIMAREQFDLVVGDEAYELVAALLKRQVSLRKPLLAVHDFFGIEPCENNLFERFLGYLIVRTFHATDPKGLVDFLFVGELEDLPDERFGPFLPNCREWARKNCRFLGYVVPFSATDYSDQTSVRRKLGYGDEPLVICSIGGTAIGKDLLELCGRSYPLIQQKVPGVRMILVCGPRLSPDSLNVPEGVERRGYVPSLYEHFAAGDLTIVQGGGTSTTELTALRRPFLYFPLDQHFEQQVYVAGRQKRLGAGCELRFADTTAESLAEQILSSIGQKVDYPQIRTDGARVAAQIIERALFD